MSTVIYRRALPSATGRGARLVVEYSGGDCVYITGRAWTDVRVEDVPTLIGWLQQVLDLHATMPK